MINANGSSSILDIDFHDTSEISVPPKLIDQVLGQDKAVRIIRKAALQGRHVMLIGEPGTGKSLLGAATAELLPKDTLEDILVVANPKNPNNPRIITLPSGEGRARVEIAQERARKQESTKNLIAILIPLSLIFLFGLLSGWEVNALIWATLVALFAFMVLNSVRGRSEFLVPKILVDTSQSDTAPFVDATGAHSGALLGDVRHDPFQSGGLGTPAHERVEVGLIHKANKGILYIDEVGTLNIKTQQKLLTALQEKKFPITGQSELSSGAMVRTEPVPCNFILIAAGNQETIRNLHPALRSRIRGQGYEIVMETTMEDNMANRRKLARFVSQEVAKDHKIPHFTKAAVEQVIFEAQRRAGRPNSLTLLLRDLGGLVRTAGDLAVERGHALVTAQDVLDARHLAVTLENQLSLQLLEARKDYELFEVNKGMVGRVNGLAVYGNSAGSVMPIEAAITPASMIGAGRIYATGQLRVIARESVQNISALVKTYLGKDIANHDIHIQFVGVHGVDGDSASITIATAIVSAIEDAPVRQDTAMTGSLSVRGQVLPIGGVTYKAEAAARVGIKRVIIPHQNLKDLKLDPQFADKLEIIPVKSFDEVLRAALIPEYSYVADKFATKYNKTEKKPINPPEEDDLVIVKGSKENHSVPTA
ncbi:MAG: ATP-dependent protease LonB [Methanobacteriota archaeon]|nr:MAG: ATP-dependent protease LonB [Euryarchaeota archaeon]